MKTINCEREIKARVIESLRRSGRFGHRPVVATEFCIGRSGVRADLVVLSRAHELIGIEIKSASDTLKRLPNQLDAYGRYFDFVILVAASRHQNAVRQIDVPRLEIWEVEKSGSLGLVRPGCSRQQIADFTPLLTQRDRSRYRGFLQEGAAGSRTAFLAAFEERHGPSSNRFWESVGSRRITAEALNELSRFEDVRAIARLSAHTEAARMASWAALEAA